MKNKKKILNSQLSTIKWCGGVDPDWIGVDTNPNYCYALNMELFKKKNRQEGQTLLIVVLIMVISLTVGLSIASKTITSLRTTTEEVNSAQALSAAETGISQVIQSGEGTGGTKELSANLTFSATPSDISGTNFLVNAGNVISQDEGADVWLIAHDLVGNLDFSSPWGSAGETLTIYWGDSSDGCTNAALEMVKITGTLASNAVSTKYGYDPCPARDSNNLAPVSQSVNTVSGRTFYYTATINVTNGLLVRIIPLYTNAVLAVAGTAALPSQGSIITSTGISSNVVRRISVVANYYSLPSEFFTYGLFVPK